VQFVFKKNNPLNQLRSALPLATIGTQESVVGKREGRLGNPTEGRPEKGLKQQYKKDKDYGKET